MLLREDGAFQRHPSLNVIDSCGAMPLHEGVRLLVFLLSLLSAVQAAETPSVGELLSYLRIDPLKQKELFSGKILSTDVTEASDKELAVGLVMFLPVPMGDLVSNVRGGKLFALDHDLIAYGELKENATPGEIAVSFAETEARDLMKSEPGSHFNLSTEEIQKFRDLSNADDPAKAAQLYQNVLFQRYEAYRKGGLNAIEPYDRGNGKLTAPGNEIQGSLNESKLLAAYFPELQRALLDYPKNQAEGITHRFFWLNENVENRPTFILAHRLSYVRPEGAFMAECQYYVGHSYDSLQILAGCLPAWNGTLIFYSNRTFTDQVAGFASGMRHSIGRDRMREDVIKGFEEFRATVPK